ncbi:MAG: bifunctional tRNA (5-methylaminomethyl-2-thiouridine)(34)-methyltransferase MnmD/FAD-dependent 5-carboxymethylaminomethyl-2-thiouridine(34) oxidoreductase MnmC [Pseudomonadota bacterium]
MLKTIVPATLEIRDGVPYSAAYGDVYHSADGGIGQARHVFLQGCGLPDAWAGRAAFTVLETGFGTGLNFLATWAAWRADPVRCARLHYCAVELHPFSADDLVRLHAHWPAFAALSSELVANWPPPVPGFHRIALDDGRVQLTLMLGDAQDCLPNLVARVDAFYFDGFAPERNADLWQSALFAACARLARPGARAATYTVAAPVRQGLAQAGFVCEKRAGYGRKRHCLAARLAGDVEPMPCVPGRVAVIGAGVAGAAVAHALAVRGIEAVVLEREAAPAQAASGNPIAVFRPVLSRDDNRSTRLTRAAFLHDLRAWPRLSGLEWARCGVLHLAKDADAEAKYRQALAAAAPPAAYAHWVDVDAARALARWPVAAAGVYYPDGGWVRPQSLTRAWLGRPGIVLCTGAAVAKIEAAGAGWRVLDAAGLLLAEADAVVLANARDAAALVPGAAWPIHTVRGQITQLPAGSLPGIERVIAREGYFAPGARPLVGATYEHDDDNTAPVASSDAANLARLENILPGAAAAIDVSAVEGRAALRATLPDRLPLVGAVSGYAGVYVAVGYASRGVVWAGVLGETLAGMLTGTPLPLEADLVAAIAPGRWG